MRVVAPLCAAVALLAAACAPKGETTVKDSAATAAPPVVDVAAVRQAIEQANAKFIDAMTRGDSIGMVANYVDDAVVMDPGAPARRGRGEIGANFAKRIQSAKLSDGKATTASVDVAGDYAIETGSFEWTVTPKGGKPMRDKGKYLTVWKKQADGSWKIYRDINNSDGPVPKS
jgi:uncharacterized protein (TIGR02246 family)